MTPSLILGIIGLYFLVLLGISLKTGSQDDNQTFFTANKNAKWYIVAFGMVGTSLSGVTFISVPGWVQSSQFTYFQVVLGYGVGYWLVSFVLLPLYYKQGLTSIYEYLAERFGPKSHLVGALSFFISRTLGAAFRLFLVAIVLQQYVFAQLGIPFEITVVLSVALIWFYTHRGGIKTIVWTDSLQTLLMIIAVVLSIVYMGQNLNLSTAEIFSLDSYPDYNRIWIFDDPSHRQYFWKAFIGGAFITLCMTGLDQDMMQKNLSCRNLHESQKNMLSFSLVLVGVTALFLLLGALNYNYAAANSIALPVLNGSPRTDLLFPEIALNSNLGAVVGGTFILGLIAAAYSSADSALAALTTSYCIDWLKLPAEAIAPKRRKKIHLGMSALLVGVVIVFYYVLSSNVIDSLLTVASYTYGPLLGLYSFGMFTSYKIDDKKVVLVCVSVLILVIGLANLPVRYLGGYQFGYELLPLNGLLTFLGLVLIRRK